MIIYSIYICELPFCKWQTAMWRDLLGRCCWTTYLKYLFINGWWGVES